MTHQQYFQCVIATLIGNLIHIVFKILSTWKDYKANNLQFSIIGYLKTDRVALIADAIGSFAIVFIIDEWIVPYPQILSKIKTLFVCVGFSGSYLIMQIFSEAKSRFRAAVKHKADISDNLTGTLGTPTPALKPQKTTSK